MDLNVNLHLSLEVRIKIKGNCYLLTVACDYKVTAHSTLEIFISLNKNKWLILAYTIAKKYKVLRASKDMEVRTHSK